MSPLPRKIFILCEKFPSTTTHLPPQITPVLVSLGRRHPMARACLQLPRYNFQTNIASIFLSSLILPTPPDVTFIRYIRHGHVFSIEGGATFAWGRYIPPNSQKFCLRRAKKKRSPVSPKSFLLREKNCHTPSQPVLPRDIKVLEGGEYIPPISPHAHVYGFALLTDSKERNQC